MTPSKNTIITANEAVARIAYKTNEVFPIYPITPASEMSELVEKWSAEGQQNVFGHVPSTIQMQSEAGVAGTMHGLLQTGSLSTTFTASQGLLLMLPNMYKIAGELTPNVIHVATRSIATHALSIFGDHSDIMAVRQSGYAILGSSSVQEAHDMALIAQVATLSAKIPFIHFFDGFRTSHEISTIKTISDDVIQSMLSIKQLQTHRNRALSPKNPVIRGTAQGPDVFFQNREAQNSFYNRCPEIVQQEMNRFACLTGRQYKLFDYIGHDQAEHVIVAMASSTETVEQTINHLNAQGQRLGLIKVRLFRPFSSKHLLNALPESTRSITVLDRTKEPGSTGEPLYLDVVQSIMDSSFNQNFYSLPKVIGGRYGLSSKELTPSMVATIINNSKNLHPKRKFTIGIHDDVTNLSLDILDINELNDSSLQIKLIEDRDQLHQKKFKNLLQLISNNKNVFVQGYSELDYKKSNTTTTSHLRISNNPIKAPYLIEQADIIACQNADFTINRILETVKPEGTLIINSPLTSKAFWQALSANEQQKINENRISLFIINLEQVYELIRNDNNSISLLQNCLFALHKDILSSPNSEDLSEYMYKVDTSVTGSNDPIPFEKNAEFANSLLGNLLRNNGNDIPVSLLPPDGTFATNTSKFNRSQSSEELPIWRADDCIQCGACSMVCPQAALRLKVYEDHILENAPIGFKSVRSKDFDLMNFTLQINPDQCNACNHCIEVCDTNALSMTKRTEVIYREKNNWDHFTTIPEVDRRILDSSNVSQQQLQEPLFKYPIGVEGCGEAPYLKLMTQLFGDRLLVANATGTSSIVGGALPTTPWSKNKDGNGPAWSNSLFEDNAEFGLGFRLSIDQKETEARSLLNDLLPELEFDLAHDILNSDQYIDSEIEDQRLRIEKLKDLLKGLGSKKAHELLERVDHLVKKSVWIVGGDGWAYDIGFGGIDHVIESGKNVNILILDNEIYDNTGGQASKATPFGSKAKFASKGKSRLKKDLGRIAMTYDNVYVSSIAFGADQEATLQAFIEADSFDGPSILLAYAHSNSHGIDMKNPGKHHKAAVKSGQWVLYRHDPRKSKPFQLDSDMPSIGIEEYLRIENRFSHMFNQDPKSMNSQIQHLQNQINKRFNFYLSLEQNQSVNQKKLF